MIAPDLARIREMARYTLVHEADSAEPTECQRCGETFEIDADCEPTSLCHHCAQETAIRLAKFSALACDVVEAATKWANNTGECHFCNFVRGAHDDSCPLDRLLAEVNR